MKPQNRNRATFACLGAHAQSNSIAVLLGGCLLAGLSAYADYDWTGTAGDGMWTNSANWIGTATDNNFIDTGLANFPIVNTTPAWTPNDLKIGSKGGSLAVLTTGRVDVVSGTLNVNYWTFVGDWAGLAYLNIADTAAVGGLYTGYGQGTGSFNATNNGNGNFMVGLYHSTGIVNMNTTGSLAVTQFRISPNNASGSGTFNLDSGTVSVAGSFENGSDYWGANSTNTSVFNMSGGSVTAGGEFWTGGSGAGVSTQTGGEVSSGQWFVVGRNSGSAGTYNLVNGTVAASTASGFPVVGSFSGSQGTLNVSGGTFMAANNSEMRVGETGTGTLNVSGSGLVVVSNTAAGVVLGLNSGSIGTNNLDGGTLLAAKVSGGAGSSTFNFNGGTLKPTGSSPAFMTNINTINVRDGGAIIDTDGFDVSILPTLSYTTIPGDSGTGGLTKNGAGTLTLGGGYGFGGPLAINAGGVSVDTTLAFGGGGAITIAPGATLAVSLNNGSGYVSAGDVTFNGATTLNLNYGTVSYVPSAAVIQASGTLTPGTATTINISAIGMTTTNYPLISFGTGSATTNGFVLGTLPPGVSAVLTNSTATTLDLLVTSSVQLLTWRGTEDGSTVNPNWDINTSSNWQDATFSTQAKYLEYGANGDSVTFGDSGFNLTGTNDVVLNTNVTPATLSFNSYYPYTLTGSGSIGGSATLEKSGFGSLFLGTANTYTGGNVISGGTLIITNDNALGNAASSVSLAGGNLQLEGTMTSARPITRTAAATLGVGSSVTVTLSGGITGTGDLTANVGTNSSVTLSGGFSGGALTASVETNSSAVISGPVTTGNSALTKLAEGTLTLTDTNDLGTGNFWVRGGTLVMSGTAYATNNNWNSVGRDELDNAVMTMKDSAKFESGNDFNMGDYGTAPVGVLNIQDAAVLEASQIFVASANSDNSQAAGTVNQTGGTVRSRTVFLIGGRNANGALGVGVYNLQNGTLETLGTTGSRIGGYGTGTMNQSGGTFLAISNGINLARFPGGSGTYNLGGGVLETFNVASSTGSNAVFNFNGGTLKSSMNNAAFMQGLSQVNVQSGGAIIDCASNHITIAQALLNGGGGGGVTKLGAGTLTLTGSNTYAGPTILSQGTLALSPVHQNTSTEIRAAGSTVLQITCTGNQVTRSGGLTAGATALDGVEVSFLLPAGTNPVAAIYECGALTNHGTLNIRVGGLLNAGTFPVIKYTGTLAGGGTLNTTALVPHGYSGVVSNDAASSTIYITLSGAGGIVWQGDNTDPALTNLWKVGVTNWLSGIVDSDYIEGDKVVFDDGGNATVILSNSVSPGGMIITNNSVNYVMSGPGAIAGVGGLTKSGTASARLTFAGNTFSGPTVIEGGLLTIAGGGSLGDSSAVTVANVSGAGLTISGNETIGSLSGGGGTGGNVSITNDLIISGSSSTTYGGVLAGPGRLRVQGVGTMTVTGSVNVAGEVWVGGGSSASSRTLNIPSGATVGSGNWWVIGRDGSAGTVNVNGGTLLHHTTGNLTLGSLGTNPRGIINLNSGIVSNAVGSTYLGEGSSGGNYGEFNQSGGTAVLGSLFVGRNTASSTGVFHQVSGTAMATSVNVGENDGKGTMTLAGGVFNCTGVTRVGNGNNASDVAVGIINVSNATFNSEGDLLIGFAGSGSATGQVNIASGGVVNVASTTKRWMIMRQYDPIVAELNINGGTLNLNANTDLRFSIGNSTGPSTVNLNAGSITAYSGNQTGTGSTAVLDLNYNNAVTDPNNTFNLNGGTLTIGGIIRNSTATGGNRLFNFNGGVLKPTASSTAFFGAGVASAANIRLGGAIIDTDGKDIHIGQDLINNGFEEDGGLTKNGAGTLYLNGVNTYTNVTTVTAGALGGSGTIAGSVNVGASGALAPGASIGTLGIAGNLNLAGNLLIEVNTSTAPSNDLCIVTGTATCTGTGKSVIVTNLGSTLAVGDTFKLFSGTLVNGQNLAITGIPGVTWTNELATLGQIRVLAVAPPVATTPTNITFSASGGTLSLSWPSNYLGWTLQVQTNSRSVGLSNNWFDVTGSESMTSTNITVNPNDPTLFYRLRYLIP